MGAPSYCHSRSTPTASLKPSTSGLPNTNASGQAVKEVQANINQTTEYKPKLEVDGEFGSKTKKAVLTFQHEFKIKPYDGIVGPKTWKVLRAK